MKIFGQSEVLTWPVCSTSAEIDPQYRVHHPGPSEILLRHLAAEPSS